MCNFYSLFYYIWLLAVSSNWCREVYDTSIKLKYCSYILSFVQILEVMFDCSMFLFILLMTMQWYSRCCYWWCWGRASKPNRTSYRSNSCRLCCLVIGKEKSWCTQTFENFHWSWFSRICTNATGSLLPYFQI